jgi:hypothetical protein
MSGAGTSAAVVSNPDINAAAAVRIVSIPFPREWRCLFGRAGGVSVDPIVTDGDFPP